jgi:hypothetical protein
MPMVAGSATNLVTPTAHNQQKDTTMRYELQQSLATALMIAEDPETIFCVQSFASVEREGTDRLGDLLARVMADPKNSFVLTTEGAFVFAFGNRLGRNNNKSSDDTEMALTEQL